MTEARRHQNVVNLSELEPETMTAGTNFGHAEKHLGFETGARGIGCSWFEVPPGRAAFPRHFHCAKEEAVFVLEGEGLLRIGDKTVPLRPGDYATFPVGPGHAHQIHNAGKGPLRYLCFAPLVLTDVIGYPDSGKFAATAIPSVKEGLEGAVWADILVRNPPRAGYFDGEDTG
jgi:uncharacterized cupin superfamily protein